MSFFEQIKNLIYNGASWINMKADASSSAVITVEFAHHEIHEGDHFTYADFVDLGNGASHDLLIVTPDTAARCHLIWEVATESEATIIAYEDTVTSNDGTGVTAYNNRRDSATAPTVTLTHTPTVTGVGTQLIRAKLGSGKSVGGARRGDAEWILDQNSKYMLRITNDTALNNWVSWSLSWYEHTDDA